MKKGISFTFILLFAIIFCINFVNSAITVVRPLNYTNFTGAFGPLVVFNVSYVNGTDFTDAKNATFYYNLSGTWTKIGSTLDCNNGAVFGSCNGTLNLSGLTDGLYAINATISNTTTFGKSATVFTYNITFDSTAPNVSTFYTSTNNGNYSGTITLNVSVSDALIGIESVYFNITNSSGVQINFTKATNISGIYYNISIDTSTFTDGKYNITVYSNDSLNNLNNSKKIQITLDNTAPTGSFTCTPTQAYSGDIITCACVVTDGTSGENTSATTYTSSIVTSDTGTFYPGCSFADLAGNFGTATTEYNVRMYSSSSSSGGSSSTTFTYSKTIPTTGDLSETQTIVTSALSGGGLAVKQKITFTLNSESHYLGIRELNSSSVKIELASTPVQLILNIGGDTKVDLDEDGYYDVYIVLNGITNSKADLTINYLHELISSSTSTTTTEETTPTTTSTEPETSSSYWIWIVVGIILLVVIGSKIIFKKRKK